MLLVFLNFGWHDHHQKLKMPTFLILMVACHLNTMTLHFQAKNCISVAFIGQLLSCQQYIEMMRYYICLHLETYFHSNELTKCGLFVTMRFFFKMFKHIRNLLNISSSFFSSCKSIFNYIFFIHVLFHDDFMFTILLTTIVYQ